MRGTRIGETAIGALALTAMVATPALAQTSVSGTVSGTWGLAGSPYVVDGDELVATGMALTIEAGGRRVRTSAPGARLSRRG